MKKGVLYCLFVLSFSHSNGQNELKQIDHFGANPGNLNMYVFIPDTILPNPSLLLVLHGCSQRASSFSADSGWNELAAANGFVVIYAEQNFRNNASACFNWYADGSPCDADEMKSVMEMLELTEKQYQVDPARIFVYGVSAGAAMAVQLLACHPERFKAGVSVAGGPFIDVDGLNAASKIMHRKEPMADEILHEEIKRLDHEQLFLPELIVYHGSADKVVSEQNSIDLLRQWTNEGDYPTDPEFSEQIAIKGTCVIKQSFYNSKGERLIRYCGKGMGHWLPVDPGKTEGSGGEKSNFTRDVDFHLNYHIAKDLGLLMHTTK